MAISITTVMAMAANAKRFTKSLTLILWASLTLTCGNVLASTEPSSSGNDTGQQSTSTGEISSRSSSLPSVKGLGVSSPQSGFYGGVSVAQSWTDNYGLTSGGGNGSFVSTVTPSLGFKKNSRRLNATAMYVGQGTYAWSNSIANQRTWSNSFLGSAQAEILTEKLYFDAYASILLSPNTVSGYDAFNSQSNTTRNSSAYREVRTVSFGPFTKGRLSNAADFEVRYKFTHYDGLTASSTAPTTKHEQSVSGSMHSANDNPSHFTWGVTAQQMEREFINGVSQTIQQLNSGVAYTVTPSLQIGMILGYDAYDRVSASGKQGGVAYGGNIHWAPNSRTRAYLEIVERYFGTTSQASLSWKTGVALLTAQYQKQLLTSADAGFLLFDPTNPFSTNAYNGGVNQQSSIAAYVLGPQGVVNQQFSINYGDYAVFDERLTFGTNVGFRRSNLGVYAFVTDRNQSTAYELLTVDPRTGTQTKTGVFTSRTKQQGFSINYTQNLSSLSSASAFLLFSRTALSNPGSVTSSLRTIGSTYRNTLGPRSSASLTVRHSDAESNGTSFSENAIIGTFDVRF